MRAINVTAFPVNPDEPGRYPGKRPAGLGSPSAFGFPIPLPESLPPSLHVGKLLGRKVKRCHLDAPVIPKEFNGIGSDLTAIIPNPSLYRVTHPVGGYTFLLVLKCPLYLSPRVVRSGSLDN